MSQEFESPLSFEPQNVASEWVDFNGHMNVAYYIVAFDRCVDGMYNRLGIGPAQMAETNCSVFTLEAHINYLREVVEGDPLRIEGRLMDYDRKRVHAREVRGDQRHRIQNGERTEGRGLPARRLGRHQPIAFSARFRAVQLIRPDRLFRDRLNFGQKLVPGAIGVLRDRVDEETEKTRLFERNEIAERVDGALAVLAQALVQSRTDAATEDIRENIQRRQIR